MILQLIESDVTSTVVPLDYPPTIRAVGATENVSALVYSRHHCRGLFILRYTLCGGLIG